ncbi:helix-turn-helix domain-containing protein [Neisseria dumasiana]|uniref:helix-turn-helix domain-containing protein n=1 Tax=Neisseria dumasiana TaxID=1931275 RepID=UPI000A18A753|nr:helix-turn-helix transcriptional regulator [Neisseria dumasiana]OSI16590.1 hypothetical protein BV914_03110 [Neisseria dumasiana]
MFSEFDVGDPNFPSRLKQARMAKGWTQLEFSEKVGISLAMIQRYEMEQDRKYHAKPRRHTLEKMNSLLFQSPQPAGFDFGEKDNLKKFTTEELLDEIQSRGYEITLLKK